MVRIPYLSKLLKAVVVACDVAQFAGPKIRTFVPEESRANYDTALQKIVQACDVLRTINYLDQNSGTNPPFGRR